MLELLNAHTFGRLFVRCPAATPAPANLVVAAATLQLSGPNTAHPAGLPSLGRPPWQLPRLPSAGTGPLLAGLHPLSLDGARPALRGTVMSCPHKYSLSCARDGS
jgi:hypothetical protein